MRPGRFLAAILLALMVAPFLLISKVQAQDIEDTLSRLQRATIQSILTERGFDTNGNDGVFGPNTRRAITAYQLSLGQEGTGFLSAENIADLAGTGDTGFRMLEGFDLPYNDFRSGMDDRALKNITVRTCMSLCTDDNRCRAFTYNVSAKVCFLKDAAAEPTAFSGAISGIKEGTISPAQQSASAPQTSRGGFEILTGMDLPYNDYQSGMDNPNLRDGTAESCQSSCAQDRRCLAYTFNSSAKVCFLKEAAAEPVRFAGAISGRRITAAVIDYAGWETDPKALFRWVDATLANYRPVSTTMPDLADVPDLSDPAILALPSGLPVDLSTIPPGDFFYGMPKEFQSDLNLKYDSWSPDIENERIFLSDTHRHLIDMPIQLTHDQRPGSLYATLVRERERIENPTGDADPARQMLAAYAALDMVRVLKAAEWQRKDSDSESIALLDRATQFLLRPMTGDDRLRRSLLRGLAGRTRTVLTEQQCETSPSDETAQGYVRVAAMFNAAGQSSHAVAAALRSAAKCAESPQKALGYQRMATKYAISTGDSFLMARTLLDLGVQLYPEDRAGSRTAIQAAFAVDDGEGVRQLYRWGGDQFDRYDILEDLGLTDETDLLLAGLTSQAFENGINDDVATISGMVDWSWYDFIGKALEDFGRYDVANSFYAYMTFPADDTSAHPGNYPLRLADNEIALGNLDKAKAYLERALSQTPPGSADMVRLKLLAQLAEANEQSGNFAASLLQSQEALILVSVVSTPEAAALGSGLQAGIERAMAETGGGGDVATAQLERLKIQLLSCETSGNRNAPLIPHNFLFGDLEPALFFKEAAALYRACVEEDFATLYTTRPAEWPNSQEAFDLLDYFHVLTGLNDSEAVQSSFQLLLDTRPETIKGGKEDLRFARQRYINRLVAGVQGTLEGGNRELASDLIDQIWPALTKSDWDNLVADASEYVETPANYVQLLQVLGRQKAFLERAAELEAQRQATSQRNSCYGPPCEVALEYAQAIGDTAQVTELSSFLEVGMVIYNAGASADSQETASIQAEMLYRGQKTAEWGLWTTALTYFDIAGATPETVLNDDRPLDYLETLKNYIGLANTLRASGDTDGAHIVSRHLVMAAQAKVAEAEVFADDALLRWSSQLRSVFETYLLTVPVNQQGEVAPEDRAPALFSAQFIQASGTAATLTKLGSRSEQGDQNLVRQYQDLQPRLTQAYARLADVASNGNNQEARQTVLDLEAERSRITDALNAQDPRYFTYGQLQFATQDTLQASLGEHEAMFAALPFETATILIWLDDAGLKVLRQPKITAPALQADISGLRAAMVSTPSLPDVPVGTAFDLYQHLLAPFSARLATTEHLLVVPFGALEGLPLAALVTEPPTKPSLTADELLATPPAWLVRSVDISVIPSMAALNILRDKVTASKATRPFLGLGNPSYAMSGPTAIKLLPETETEVRFIAGLTGADPHTDLLLRENATKARLTALPLDQYRLLNFATHGFLAGGIAGLDEPALALSASSENDDATAFLTSGDVLDLKLDADLVILSACSTAGPDGAPGADGLSGFANAFFYAGARSLVVTHWNIPSGPAMDISTGLIDNKQANPELSWAQALRLSVLGMIDKPASPLKAHPVSWASHFVVGAT